MNNPNRGGKSNRAFGCIFCASRSPLTREHIIPDWISKYVPRTNNHNYHWTSYLGQPLQKGKVHRPGDPYSQRLRIACEACNSGWMSRLQNKAKSILIPLIEDKVWNMNQEEQAILTAWSAMTTMVIEYADPKTAYIPQEHRKCLMDTGRVPDTWAVWIGRHNPGARHPAFFNHFGGYYVPMLPFMPYGLIRHCFQSTGFTVGRLFIQTATIDPFDYYNDFQHENFAHGYDIRTIFPFFSPIRTKPFLAHGSQGIERISSNMAHYFGLTVYGTKN